MILLIPMQAREFAAYVEHAIPAYAQDKVDSGQWSIESSMELSRQAYEALLPRGVETVDHFLFNLRDDSTQFDVGMLWYAVQEQANARIAYLYDVLVKPQHRRKGYAAQAFAALETDAASRGLCGIGLHVFGHNTAAQALYARLGYRTTNLNMFKSLPAADFGPIEPQG